MKNNKVALITGITGQDGSYLAEFLLDKGYTVLVLNDVHLLLTRIGLIIFIKPPTRRSASLFCTMVICRTQ